MDPKDPLAHCNVGTIYSAKNLVEEAILSFKKASELDPESSIPHTNLGSLYASLGKVETALKEFKKSTLLNPGDAHAWFNLYDCYREIGRTKDAQEAYKTYEELSNQASGIGAAGGDASAEAVMKNITGGT